MKSLAVSLALAAGALAATDLSKPLTELRLRDGKVLRQVEFVAYAASNVMAKWDGGRGTIAYEQLPADVAKAIEPLRPKPALPPTDRNEDARARQRAFEDAVKAAKQTELKRQRVLETAVAEKKIVVGMDRDQVTRAWGPPMKKNTSGGTYGTREQWVYSADYLYFEEGVLKSWQSSR